MIHDAACFARSEGTPNEDSARSNVQVRLSAVGLPTELTEPRANFDLGTLNVCSVRLITRETRRQFTADDRPISKHVEDAKVASVGLANFRGSRLRQPPVAGGWFS